MRIWLTAIEDSGFLVATSRGDVLNGLADLGAAATDPLRPALSRRSSSATSPPSIACCAARSSSLARCPTDCFTSSRPKPRTCRRRRKPSCLAVRRVGQVIFRRGLLEYWDGRCAITGLDVPDLLRASHIKPWADCNTDAERLDVFNGLLLAPHLDAAFDAASSRSQRDGTVLLSDALPSGARLVLGLDEPLNVHRLHRAHERYLPWHRTRIFCNQTRPSARAHRITVAANTELEDGCDHTILCTVDGSNSANARRYVPAGSHGDARQSEGGAGMSLGNRAGRRYLNRERGINAGRRRRTQTRKIKAIKAVTVHGFGG